MMTAIPNATGDPAQRVTALAKASNARVTGCAFAWPGLAVVGTVSMGAASGNGCPRGPVLTLRNHAGAPGEYVPSALCGRGHERFLSCASTALI